MGDLAAEYGGSATSSGPVYVTVDTLGSTRLVTDSDGVPVERHDYLPFGGEVPLAANGRSSVAGYGVSGVRVKFTGKERDAETGLDYFGARHFSGAQGRWTSPDAPFADQHLEEPQSWNMYAYVRNNPLRYVDPNGRDAQQTFNAAEMKSIQRDMTAAANHPVLTASIIAGAALAPEAGAAISLLRAAGTAAFGWILGHPAQVQETMATMAEGASNAPPGSLTSGFGKLGATTGESVERKLSQYLLNSEHPVGGTKAKWFEQALGYTKENMADLAKQIVFDPKSAIKTGTTEYGTQYNQVINVVGANGKTIAREVRLD